MIIAICSILMYGYRVELNEILDFVIERSRIIYRRFVHTLKITLEVQKTVRYTMDIRYVLERSGLYVGCELHKSS